LRSTKSISERQRTRHNPLPGYRRKNQPDHLLYQIVRLIFFSDSAVLTDNYFELPGMNSESLGVRLSDKRK
jgi:hypothetical protein